MKAWPLLLGLALACTRHPSPGAGPDAGDGGGGTGGAGLAGGGATPVKVAPVERATLKDTVRGPGQTNALEQQKVRAPFRGVLLELRVADGDRVKDGQVVAVVVSQDSMAAVQGAQAMVKAARTPRERSDAQRAVELARKGLVRTELRAPEAGIVVAHGADEGALVADTQDLVSLAATDSFTFRADLVQTDLARIRPGQNAEVRLASIPSPLQGVVHSILPDATSKDLTVPVRIDFGPSGLPPALGLFGTAAIVVGERQNVPVVPAAAVLKDDISGVQQVAIVTDQNQAHWVRVTTGLTDADKVELTSPEPKPGERVIVQGLVGLPEGAGVQVQP